MNIALNQNMMLIYFPLFNSLLLLSSSDVLDWLRSYFPSLVRLLTSENDLKPIFLNAKYKFQKDKDTYHWPIQASSICVVGESKPLKTLSRDPLVK